MHGRQDEEHSQIPHTQASASFTNAYDMPNGLPMDAYSMEGLDATFFNQTNLNLANFDEIGALDPQFLDLIENNGSFDLQGLDQDGAIADDMEEEELPDRKSSDDVSELHDKRKSPEDEKEDNENGSKRRDGEEKVAKKPGRKPLTSEPTTVSHTMSAVFLSWTTLILSNRNGRHKIEPLNVPLENERRSISRIWRIRLWSWKRNLRQRIMRTLLSNLRLIGFRSKSESIGNDCR